MDNLQPLEVGDIVYVTDSNRVMKLRHRECFVEEVLLDLRPHMPQRVSLYATDGEYVGDYLEDEVDRKYRKISQEKLKELMYSAFKEEHWGLILDFARVWLIIEGKVV